MTKQRLEREFTSKEMESWAQEVRRAMKEEPDENEEAFPNDADELRHYILTLEENIKDKPTAHLREELRTYKAYQTGWYKGVCFTYEYFIDLKEKERVREEDKIANKIYDKKLFAYLEDQEKRMISKKELLNLKENKLTRKDLDKAGIKNTGRYLVDGELDEPENDILRIQQSVLARIADEEQKKYIVNYNPYELFNVGGASETIKAIRNNPYEELTDWNEDFIDYWKPYYLSVGINKLKRILKSTSKYPVKKK